MLLHTSARTEARPQLMGRCIKIRHVRCCTSRPCSTPSPVLCLGSEPHAHRSFGPELTRKGQGGTRQAPTARRAGAGLGPPVCKPRRARPRTSICTRQRRDEKISGGGNYRGMGVGRHRARDDLCKHGRFERVCKLAHDAGMNPEVKVREIRIDKPKTPANHRQFRYNVGS